MKRDMELFRKILFKIEDSFEPGEGFKRDLSIEGYDLPMIADHCELLYQAGLISEYKPSRGGEGYRVLFFGIGGLTNYGHDYLELIRNDEIWNKTKNEIKEKNIPNTISNIGVVAGSILGAFMRELNR